MIQKFKNFDSAEFIRKKKALKQNVIKESVDDEMNDIFGDGRNKTMEMPKDDPEINDEDVITGTPVYTDKFLLKIANIIGKRLNSLGIGNFSVTYNIVYLNGNPGVLFFDVDGEEKAIVCCRTRNLKTLTYFKNFKFGEKNTAAVTYSSEKYGFTDMLEQLMDELREPEPQMNEERLVEAGGYGDGYGDNHIANFKKLKWIDKCYMYDLLSKKKKGDAILHLKTGINNNDRDVIRILATFSPTGKASGGGAKYIVGLVADIMNNRYPGANKDLDDLVKEYQNNYAGGGSGGGTGNGPAIAAQYGMQYEVTDEDAEAAAREEARREAEEERLREDREKYMETIEGLEATVHAMCNYVKNNGTLDRDDASAMSRRGVILTGKGGIGKTKTLKTVLKSMNMIKNKDYIWVSSESVTADKLYTLMYQYNGKLLIFDDTGDIFEGKYNGPLWKTALQTELEDCEIGYPGRDSKLNTYNDRTMRDRQKRYYAEIGVKSDEDKHIFYKKEMKKRGLSYSKIATGGVVSSDPDMTQADIELLMQKIDDEWKEAAADVQPAMPTHFIYTGVVVIISNMDRKEFIAEMGEGSWKALASRFKNYDINPLAESLWAKMKAIILREFNDTSIPDDNCAIPRNMTEEFIEEVETAIAENRADGLTFRTIVAFGVQLRGKPGLKTWRRDLRDELAG